MTPYQRIEKVIRYVSEHCAEQPRLPELARVAGLSPFHFHRLFSRWAGTTPKAFLKYLTSEHAKTLLADSKDVLSVALEAGLSGPGRLHDLLVTVDGVTPGEFKAGGAALEIRYGSPDTPFGPAFLAETARGVCHLEFAKPSVAGLRRRWPNARLVRDERAAAATASRIFGRGRARRIGVVLRGSPFQLKVWEALLRVPEGKVVTYGALAKAIGKPRASRAVGSAVGANAIGYLIPCHRVIQGAGLVGGYRWGRSRKRALLAWESARR